MQSDIVCLLNDTTYISCDKHNINQSKQQYVFYFFLEHKDILEWIYNTLIISRGNV